MGVDFVVNCYERTYRAVLHPGFVAGLAAAQQHPFESVTVLINNVNDRTDAEQMAAALSEVRVLFVADHLSAALKATGLAPRHLRYLPHFTDCCLVAVTLDGPEHLVYWDADARLKEPHDWIGPTLDFMSAHPEVAVGNPDNWHKGLAVKESEHVDEAFAVGFGFSDVAFLARRSEFAKRIYRHIAPAAWRYPLAHVEPIFEQRVDAYMRRTGRLRATYLQASYTHEGDVGINYKPRLGVRERARRKAFARIGPIAARLDHPATRAR